MQTVFILSWCLILALGHSEAAPKPECAAVLCLSVECLEDQISYRLPGECCQGCRPKGNLDCSVVKCDLPDCPPGSQLFTPPGHCCSKCRPDRLKQASFLSNTLCNAIFKSLILTTYYVGIEFYFFGICT